MEKNLLIITDMDSFASNETKIDQMYDDNFIAVTTREGSRGADFKGLTKAYVIINLNEITLSEI